MFLFKATMFHGQQAHSSPGRVAGSWCGRWGPTTSRRRLGPRPAHRPSTSTWCTLAEVDPYRGPAKTRKKIEKADRAHNYIGVYRCMMGMMGMKPWTRFGFWGFPYVALSPFFWGTVVRGEHIYRCPNICLSADWLRIPSDVQLGCSHYIRVDLLH